MSQASSAGHVATTHLRVPWDARRRDPQYAVAIVQAAAGSQNVRADAGFVAKELHIYGIGAGTLRKGLCAVIAAAEREQFEAAEHAKFLPGGAVELPEHLRARWDAAEATTDYAATIRAALFHEGENHG